MPTKRLLILTIIFLSGFFELDFATSQTMPLTRGLTPRVDERVELLSIVFRLAGNAEYRENWLPAYSGDIDRYFAPYKNHPVVQMAQALAEKNGLGYDGVMVMAIYASPPPELKPLVAFSRTIPDERWAPDSEKFLALLRDFYRDSKFAAFYAAHQSMYRLAEERFTTRLEALDLGWYGSFYGKIPDLTFHVILGMNNGGGNYGPRLTHPDGRTELFSIIGCWTHDDAGNPTYPSDQGYLSNIIHEFNHSFVNPAVREHWKEFSDIEEVYVSVADQLRRMAYTNAETMVNESLVRAGVIVYFQQKGEDARRNLGRIRSEQRLGFYWMDRLVEELRQYQAHREQYPTFSSYVPQIAQFYRELGLHASGEAAAFDAKCAHVVKMEPFPNHTQDADASIRAITIVTDKPLDPRAGYSINTGIDGSKVPLAGNPEFSADGQHILLRVQLKPSERYSFVLTSLAFATPDGYPLADYMVEFKTK